MEAYISIHQKNTNGTETDTVFGLSGAPSGVCELTIIKQDMHQL